MNRKENSVIDHNSAPTFGFYRRSRSAPFDPASVRSSYPTNGIIQSSPPGWLDLGQLHRYPKSQPQLNQSISDYRKRKIDLEEASSKCNSTLCKLDHQINSKIDIQPFTTEKDFNEGRKTSELYLTETTLPDRFNNPSWFKGYGCERSSHPFYKTTSSAYGSLPPNVHTMPHKYYPFQKLFSEQLSSTGMLRNRSLNIK